MENENSTLVDVITFGCRLNRYESEILKDILHKTTASWPDNGRKVVVFNSCAVTMEAERQLRQAIRRVYQQEKGKVMVGVVGCAAQLHPEVYAQMPEVSFVLGNSDKLESKNYFTDTPVVVTPPRKFNCQIPSGYGKIKGMSRAFVQIQNGCNNSCSFCATRLVRGRSVSAEAENILEQIKRLVDDNCLEIVLTGVNICDYRDPVTQMGLGELVRNILTKTMVNRLRLTSLDVADLDKTLQECVKFEKRLMPHLHLSLQSGNNVLLHRMQRRNTREDVLVLGKALAAARPELVWGADMIAGFPTETPEMHQDSLRLVEELPITYGHVFPYQERPGTTALLLTPVPKNIRRLRAQELREKIKCNLQTLKDNLKGTCQKVLVETKNLGRLENYLQIELSGDYTANIGQLLTITV